MPKDQARRRVLVERVDHWSRRLRTSPRSVRVRAMARKWGSCSTLGTITLARDLADQEPTFVDFVIVHELLHLRIPNHGRLFKAMLSVHVPGWRRHAQRKGNACARCHGQANPRHFALDLTD